MNNIPDAKIKGKEPVNKSQIPEFIYNSDLTLKRLGEGREMRVKLTPCGFSKNTSSKERMKSWFF